MARMNKGNAPLEKAKDFKSAILRLLKELKPFKVLIFISLILAIISSILSICTPNILSDLTNTISEGLVINTNNAKTLYDNISSKLNEENISKVLDINLKDKNINKLITSISEDEKNIILNIINNEDDNIISSLSNLSFESFSLLVDETTINDIVISKEDKYELIKSLSQNKLNVPNSILNVLLEDMVIDNVNISKEEQIEFINNIDLDNLNELDNVSSNIKKVISPVMDLDKIKNMTIFLLSLYLLSALFNYIQSISMTDVSNKFANKLRTSISTKINRLPLKYFDQNKTGDILSRVTNDIDTIAQSMNNSLATLVSAITLFVGTTIMMFSTNWIMAITAIISSVLGFSFMSLVLSKSQKYFIAKQKELGDLNAHIEEVYSGLNVVKAYNGKSEVNTRFDELNNKLYVSNKMSQFLSGLMQPMMHFIGNFGYVMVCIVGALLTMNDYISFGVIIAFIIYVRLFTSPLTQIAQAMSNLQTVAAASERVFEFIDEEELSDEKNITGYLAKSKVKGKIEFNDVSFKYYGNENPTIKSFNLVAKPGQKIAIVGPTGAGKTTIVNLLMKFYDINSGDIKIDGVSTKNLTRKNIHDLFIMVLQDTWVFEGTIKENIKYNQEDVSDERVKEVCKIVGLDHFIKTLPNGYDTYISSNDSISAGQRQLLTIARGMIKDAPFLILDEATSNVDTRTEELVQKAMDRLTMGKTSFIIAHRLSTIKNADVILVMKDGDIIEKGSHKELMELNKFYASLYNSQFKL